MLGLNHQIQILRLSINNHETQPDNLPKFQVLTSIQFKIHDVPQKEFNVNKTRENIPKNCRIISYSYIICPA